MADKLLELVLLILFFIANFVINELRARQRKRTVLAQIELKSIDAKAEAADKAVALDTKYQQYFFEASAELQKLVVSLENERARLIEERNRDTMLKAQQDQKIGELSGKIELASVERAKLLGEIGDLKTRADSRHAEMDEQAARESALNSTILDLQQELRRCNEHLSEFNNRTVGNSEA